MKYPNAQKSGPADDLNKKQAPQQNDPAEVLPEKFKGGKFAEERNEDVAEAEVEDFFRMDRGRIPPSDSKPPRGD
jgi:hypothetical protein